MTIKEYKEGYEFGKAVMKKYILELIDKRINDLESMLEVDEPLMWETSTINYKQAEAIVKVLKEIKEEIE